jgi:hypothetical protein
LNFTTLDRFFYHRSRQQASDRTRPHGGGGSPQALTLAYRLSP